MYSKMNNLITDEQESVGEKTIIVSFRTEEKPGQNKCSKRYFKINVRFKKTFPEKG